jgi:hypothetical protein
MAEKLSLLAIFPDIDPAAQAVDELRGLGLEDGDINVISGIPVTEAMLGRPRQWSNVPRLALGGAVGGFLIGAFFAFGTPNLYPIYVGGQPLLPGAPSIVVLFELTMLGMLAATFLGVFLDSRFPSYSPKEYVPQISDGKIAIFFECPAEKEKKCSQRLLALGAESIQPAEAQRL